MFIKLLNNIVQKRMLQKNLNFKISVEHMVTQIFCIFYNFKMSVEKDMFKMVTTENQTIIASAKSMSLVHTWLAHCVLAGLQVKKTVQAVKSVLNVKSPNSSTDEDPWEERIFSTWDMVDVMCWVKDIGLTKYSGYFLLVTGAVLEELVKDGQMADFAAGKAGMQNVPEDASKFKLALSILGIAERLLSC